MESTTLIKRPPGPRPRGAIWIEGEGYQYTEEYFDIREEALKTTRVVSSQNQVEKIAVAPS